VERGFTLEGISNERWSPTGEIASQSLGTINLAKSLEIALVQSGIDLTTTFDEIEGGDRRVGDTTGNDTAESTGCVVFCGVEFDFAEGRGGGCWND
jgi:hypothetical protein